MAMLVRVKPYNPGIGAVTQSYTFRGKRYIEKEGWYKATDALAAELKKIRTHSEDPGSQLVFDVETAENAHALDVAAEEIVERRPAQRARREPTNTHREPKKRVPQGAKPASKPEPVAAADDTSDDPEDMSVFGADDDKLGPPEPSTGA